MTGAGAATSSGHMSLRTADAGIAGTSGSIAVGTGAATADCALKRAVALHGRDWVAVARIVSSKTKIECYNKVNKEVAAGRF
jgi:hypothetical protein